MARWEPLTNEQRRLLKITARMPLETGLKSPGWGEGFRQ